MGRFFRLSTQKHEEIMHAEKCNIIFIEIDLTYVFRQEGRSPLHNPFSMQIMR